MRPEERQAYRLHAKLPGYRRRIEAALDVVRRAMAAHPGAWAVACSGGKDSVALTALAHQAGWRGDLHHVRHGEMPETNTALVEAVAATLGLRARIVTVAGAQPVFDELGRAFTSPSTPDERAALRRIAQADTAAANAALIEAGYAGLFVGIRAQESRARRAAVNRWGVIHRTARYPVPIAWPIARVTAHDVWAVILEAGLPWLPAYDLADDRHRARSPTLWISDAHGWANGFAQEVERAEPALWARLTERWPELRSWT